MKSVKKYLKILSSVLLISLIALVSCEKDDDKPTPSGNGDPEVTIKGNWIVITEDVFDGPAEQPCNALYFEIKEDDYMIFSFLNSNPAAGHRGGYNIENEDSLAITIDYQYINNVYNWVAMPDPFVAIIGTDLSEDGASMIVQPDPDTELNLVKFTKSVPEELVGTWSLEYGGTLYATFEISSSGEFDWIDAVDGDEQNGILWDIGDYNGDTYLISHITYCDFDANGESDYYTINRYQIEDDELTVWHGEVAMVLTK